MVRYLICFRYPISGYSVGTGDLPMEFHNRIQNFQHITNIKKTISDTVNERLQLSTTYKEIVFTNIMMPV